MSGMAGVFYLDGRKPDRATIKAMVTSLAHRGPDGSDTWLDDQVALGHCHLVTTPESVGERLPAAGGGERFVLTADARIDNRDELIAALRLQRSTGDVITDSALILEAYAKWGEKCPERLVGDFVFAIWDRVTRRLFCARDHIGIKPFYYFHEPGSLFAFASEPKALFTLADVPRRLNETRIGDYLGDIFNDSKITYFHDVLRLPPAHYMQIDDNGATSRRYWRLDPDRELQLNSDEDYACTFRELFLETMRCRLRSAVLSGSTLSGGLDSSVIACAAVGLFRRTGDVPWNAFSAVYDDLTPRSDERPYIDAVVQRGAIQPHFLEGDGVGPLSQFDEMSRYLDEPSDNPFSSIGWVLRGMARDRGVKVMLDGNGGDVTVSYSFRYLADVARTGQWASLAREVFGLARHYYYGPNAALRVFARWVAQPLAPEPLVRAWHRFRGADALGHTIELPLNPDFANRIGFAERLEAQRERYRAAQSAKRDHILSFEEGMVPSAMEFADIANAAFGIEGRYPFFDKRLVELCVALPREQRMDRGLNRVIVRRAMGDILPRTVRDRGSKGNPNRNFAEALLSHERDRLDDVILGGSEMIEPYIDSAALQAIYRRFVGQPGIRDAYSVFTAATLAMWLRGQGPSS